MLVPGVAMFKAAVQKSSPCPKRPVHFAPPSDVHRLNQKAALTSALGALPQSKTGKTGALLIANGALMPCNLGDKTSKACTNAQTLLCPGKGLLTVQLLGLSWLLPLHRPTAVTCKWASAWSGLGLPLLSRANGCLLFIGNAFMASTSTFKKSSPCCPIQ